MIDKDWTPGQGSPVRLAILVPSIDTWDANFALCLLQLQRYLTYRPVVEEFDHMLINERGSLIALQRESMVKQALSNEDVTHLLWLDSDMEFPPNLFHRLFSHDLPMVACNYVKRAIPAMPNTRGLDQKLVATNRDSQGLEEVDSAGFGALLTKREIFENVERPWFDTVWYYPEGKDEPELMGEDVFFFRKMRKLGGYPLFIDHSISQKIGHVGTYTYENWMTDTTWDEVEMDDLKQEMMHEV